MATSETRDRPRKTGTPKAAKAPASRKAAPAAKKAAPAKKTSVATSKAAAGKATVKKVAAKKAVAKAAPGKAAPKKAAPRKALGRKQALAAAAPARPASSHARPVKKKALDPGDRLRALVLAALDDLKAKDVQEIDVRDKSSVADLLVIASGTSSRHVKSIADEVVKKAKQAGVPPIGVEGQREAEWVLVDLGDVIVHVMLPRTREFYGLERLWTVGDDMPAALAG